MGKTLEKRIKKLIIGKYSEKFSRIIKLSEETLKKYINEQRNEEKSNIYLG